MPDAFPAAADGYNRVEIKLDAIVRDLAALTVTVNTDLARLHERVDRHESDIQLLKVKVHGDSSPGLESQVAVTRRTLESHERSISELADGFRAFMDESRRDRAATEKADAERFRGFVKTVVGGVGSVIAAIAGAVATWYFAK